MKNQKQRKFLYKRIQQILLLAIGGIVVWGVWQGYLFFNETRVLKAMVERLNADHRIAEVIVTDVKNDPVSRRKQTTIKFIEYSSRGDALPARFFTFPDQLIQFQSLVVRFEDVFVQRGDWLKGKSICLFWKVFWLNGKDTVEYELTPLNEIPAGYKLPQAVNIFEQRVWSRFWDYILNPEQARAAGIKNAQVEAPGVRFVPGLLYTIRIEHDGGIRIDTTRVPAMIKGERPR